jgi:hypothetical protein
VNWPFGLYGAGMHDWLIDELELGARVAHFIDSENVFPSRAWWLQEEIDEWHRRQTGYEKAQQPNSESE